VKSCIKLLDIYIWTLSTTYTKRFGDGLAPPSGRRAGYLLSDTGWTKLSYH